MARERRSAAVNASARHAAARDDSRELPGDLPAEAGCRAMMQRLQQDTTAAASVFEYAADHPAERTGALPGARWKVLIADDEAGVHDATVYALRGVEVEGAGLTLLHAFSAAETLEVLAAHPDTAVLLLDAVMESDTAGLDAVPRIRGELGRRDLRIVLRTGQPGYAPELSALRDHDIDDYRAKAELTRTRLIATLTAAIRGFRQRRFMRDRFEAALDATVDVILMFDAADQRLLYANAGARSLLGLDPAHSTQAIGLAQLLPGLAPREVQSLVAQAGSDASTMHLLETELCTADGRRVALEARVQVACAGPQGAHTLVLVARDLSERRELERRRSEFVSLVSHELRTPLASVYGALDLLVTDPQGRMAEQDRSLLDMAFQSCTRLVRIADDMLLAARLDADRLGFHLAPAIVSRCVEAAVGEARTRLGTQDGRTLPGIVIRDASAQCAALIDSDRFLQIVDNLLANAVRYVPRGPDVEVWIRREREGVAVDVVDHGPGVPEAFLPRLFERFARAEGQAHDGGSGLGLSLSRALARGMGGDLRHAPTPGGGATFTLWVPAADPGELR
jgi:signal transduction histidine kinase